VEQLFSKCYSCPNFTNNTFCLNPCCVGESVDPIHLERDHFAQNWSDCREHRAFFSAQLPVPAVLYLAAKLISAWIQRMRYCLNRRLISLLTQQPEWQGWLYWRLIQPSLSSLTFGLPWHKTLCASWFHSFFGGRGEFELCLICWDKRHKALSAWLCPRLRETLPPIQTGWLLIVYLIVPWLCAPVKFTWVKRCPSSTTYSWVESQQIMQGEGRLKNKFIKFLLFYLQPSWWFCLCCFSRILEFCWFEGCCNCSSNQSLEAFMIKSETEVVPALM